MHNYTLEINDTEVMLISRMLENGTFQGGLAKAVAGLICKIEPLVEKVALAQMSSPSKMVS